MRPYQIQTHRPYAIIHEGKIVMADLTGRERKALLDAAKKVHAYKLMQAKGYERLVKKAKDEITKQLLADISADEFKDSSSKSSCSPRPRNPVIPLCLAISSNLIEGSIPVSIPRAWAKRPLPTPTSSHGFGREGKTSWKARTSIAKMSFPSPSNQAS